MNFCQKKCHQNYTPKTNASQNGELLNFPKLAIFKDDQTNLNNILQADCYSLNSNASTFYCHTNQSVSTIGDVMPPEAISFEVSYYTYYTGEGVQQTLLVGEGVQQTLLVGEGPGYNKLC